MKIPKILTRIMALLIALWMVGSMILSALPVSAANHEISLRRVGGYPRITFYDEEGEAIPELTDIEVSAEGLSFDSETVLYEDEEKDIDVEALYSRFDLQLAYADFNYPLTPEQQENLLENGVADFVRNSAAVIQMGDEEVEATSISFGVSTGGYLIAKMLFAGVNFLDDVNDEFTLYLQYLTQQEDGSAVMARGNTQYKLSRVETPDKDDEEEPNDGETNFGDGSENEGVFLPEDEIVITSSTPYIIVEKYSFAGGSTQVSAGSSFNLNLLCRNTHSDIDLENIIMKIGTSEGLQITNSSNTFFLDELGDKECFEKDLTISALSNAEAKSHTITVSFSYEYVADDARKQGEMTQDISIPVVQKDRFSVDPVENVSDMIVGDEIDVISKYMNKSRGELYNLTAELICDESIYCEEKIQHKGNLTAGISGEMEFTLSGSVPGTYTCEIVYSYEDTLGNVKESRVPFDVTFVEAPTYEWDQPIYDEPVMEDVVYDEFGNPIDPFAEEPQSLTQNQMLLIGGGALAVVILAAVIIKKRKAKKEFEDDDENF